MTKTPWEADDRILTAIGKRADDRDLALADAHHALTVQDERKARNRGGPELTLTFESIQTNPVYPTPEHEVEYLMDLVRNGHDPDDLRRLIDITPKQEAWLRTVTAGDPLRSRAVKRAVIFRRQVRAAFDRALETEQRKA